MKIFIPVMFVVFATLLMGKVNSKEMQKHKAKIIRVECMNNVLYNVWKERGKILWFPALDKNGNIIMCKE